MGSNEFADSSIDSKILWQRLRSGDQQALATLFNRHFDSLYSYGYRIISKRSQVKDAIQEVFFKVWKYRENLDEVQSVRSYLFVSLRRELLSSKSARSRQKEINKKYFSERFDPLFDYSKWQEILELDEDKGRDLEQALDQLTPRQKEVVYLKYFEGLTSDELSEVMELRTQSVYNLVFDAIQSLQAYLDS